jgi:hypothetical protein
MLTDIGNAQETFVHFNKDISFGKFYVSNGSSGTICISNSGGINPSQNINLLGADDHPASVIITTKSKTPIDIKIEVRAERLQSQKGNRLALTLNTPDNTFYTIMRGKPAEIYLGGCLEIVPEATSVSGEFKGIISVDVFILNK